MHINTEKINEEIKESLKHWQKIVARYQKPDTTKAIIQIITSFGPYVALWVLMYFSLNWSIFITIGLGLLNAFFLVRIFIIQHDCGHQSFFSSKKVNNAVGYVCSFFSFMPYKYWAKVHNFHHGHAGQIEVWDIGDIPTLTVKQYQAKGFWGKLGYRIWRLPIVTFVIAPIYYLLISNRLPTVRIDKLKKVYIAFMDSINWKGYKIDKQSFEFSPVEYLKWKYPVKFSQEELDEIDLIRRCPNYLVGHVGVFADCSHTGIDPKDVLDKFLDKLRFIQQDIFKSEELYFGEIIYE